MKDITTREDINLLVNRFYAKIRKDDLLGSIFNAHIAEERWPSHLEKLTDFWETNLFGISKFNGNPRQKHINVDKNLNYSITQDHFEKWLSLWFETVNQMYAGDCAERGKNLAGRMGIAQLSSILNHRPNNAEV